MTTKIHIDNHDELDKMLNGYDVSICKTIVDSIIKYLQTPKKVIHIAEVYVDCDKCVYDITLMREEALAMLQKYLYIMEYFEEYERCHIILTTINKYKNV